MNNILSILIFLPIVGSLVVAFLPKNFEAIAKWITVGISVVCLGICAYLYTHFNGGETQFFENYRWFTFEFNDREVYMANYKLGLDGLSFPLVLLAAFVQFIAAISSFEIEKKLKGYHALFLLLSGSVFGCFLAMDFFLFFVFFEFMLLPMYFLIGIWGGKNREYASIKFFIYTLLGSIFILFGLIALSNSYLNIAFTYEFYTAITDDIKVLNYQEFQENLPKIIAETNYKLVHSFNFEDFINAKNLLPNSFLSLDSTAISFNRLLVFFFLFIGFAIKLPLVPFHTWLPDAHVEAPTPISVILAGVLLKVGSYGFLRVVFPVFPEIAIQYAQLFAGLSAIAIVYGAFNALAQTDFKKMIAYSSVSHMGFVLLGIASLNQIGFQGAVYQMVSHGLLSAMLFIIVGILYRQTGNRTINHFQGLAGPMPNYTFFTAIAFFGSLGLPLFSGFIGEFLCLSGAFASNYFSIYWVYLALFGVVLGAIYFIWTFKKMFLGSFWTNYPTNNLLDVSAREIIMLILLTIPIIALGVLPNWLNDLTNVIMINLASFFN